MAKLNGYKLDAADPMPIPCRFRTIRVTMQSKPRASGCHSTIGITADLAASGLIADEMKLNIAEIAIVQPIVGDKKQKRIIRAGRMHQF